MSRHAHFQRHAFELYVHLIGVPPAGAAVTVAVMVVAGLTSASSGRRFAVRGGGDEHACEEQARAAEPRAPAFAQRPDNR
ncbi:hypothetical protein ACFY1U_12055 [Streptomyces sp. NPDC001351]|uniref:hypothetical protein n=1 Tax=Streptomyces sp. NPDC001351 TaxID=3364564 RepID=UPI0036B06088